MQKENSEIIRQASHELLSRAAYGFDERKLDIPF